MTKQPLQKFLNVLTPELGILQPLILQPSQPQIKLIQLLVLTEYYIKVKLITTITERDVQIPRRWLLT